MKCGEEKNMVLSKIFCTPRDGNIKDLQSLVLVVFFGL